MKGFAGRLLVTGLGACALCLSAVSSAQAAGFALIEQGVSGLGNAYAGGAAVAEDASTIYFNPAGLTLLEGSQAIVSLHAIKPSDEFTDKGSTTSLPDLNPASPGYLQPIDLDTNDNDGGDAGSLALIPNIYYAQNMGNWAFGLGISVPFGLSTEYNDEWVGRYYAVDSSVMTININPSIAVKASEKMSIGFGLNFMYVHAELDTMIDHGSIITAVAGGPVPGITQAQNDSKLEMDADDWAYGYNLGVLYRFSDFTRLGLSYRSTVKADVSGDANYTLNPTVALVFQDPSFAPLAAQFVDADVSGELDLPATAAISIYHAFNEKFAIMADALWTQWSNLDKLVFEIDNAGGDKTETLNWKDSWRYSIGASYRPTPDWVIRCGLAYDETPIPNAASRSVRVPGQDRTWIALGTGLKVSDWFAFDIGYAHLMVKEATVEKDAGTSSADENYFKGNLNGKFDASVDIVSAQAVFSF